MFPIFGRIFSKPCKNPPGGVTRPTAGGYFVGQVTSPGVLYFRTLKNGLNFDLSLVFTGRNATLSALL
jgi:hypothetical protein